MAERHTIVVRIEGGTVREVLFCDCCPSVTLEVRNYTDANTAAELALPEWHMQEGSIAPSPFRRDEVGVYSPTYYEPDAMEE